MIPPLTEVTRTETFAIWAIGTGDAARVYLWNGPGLLYDDTDGLAIDVYCPTWKKALLELLKYEAVQHTGLSLAELDGGRR